MKTKTIRRANGDPCESVKQAVGCWQEHFSHVLNIPSQFVEETVSSVAFMRVREELSEPPSEDEILVAMGTVTLKSGKACGKNGVLPEMLKCCGVSMLDRLVQLFQKAVSVLIVPKKGDLSNWRGISPLYVGGKLFAKTIQCRLQAVADVARLSVWR